MLNEDMVVPRIVNTQVVEFSDWCNRMANGSTVTAADVAAVMQQIENKLPETLSLNAKIVCSPNGLIFRPKVSGSLSQSELRAKLEARKAAETDPEKAAKIDVNRAISTSDLSISDCKLCIVVDLPKMWSEQFNQNATLKRVNVNGNDNGNVNEDEDEDTGGDENPNVNPNPNLNPNEDENEDTGGDGNPLDEGSNGSNGSNGSSETPGGDDNPGGGDDGEDED